MIEKNNKLYLFGTCLLDITAPKAGLAAIKILEKFGYEVIYPENQSCCSQPAFNSGYREEATKVALAQIQAFPGIEPVIVPSGSCGSMMKNHYHSLFENHPAKKMAEKFSSRIMEWSTFLADQSENLEFNDKGGKARVAVHHSCHATREMHVGNSPDQLLSKLINVELVEVAQKDVCCGFGGTFSVKFDEISGKMLEEKVGHISDAKPDYLVSTDMGCLAHIGGALKRKYPDIKVSHLAEFIWNRINM